MTALVGMGADNAGVCLGEVVVSGKEPVPSGVSAVKEEQAISDSLMRMGISPLVILPVMKEISSASLEAPPWATNSSR